MSGNQTNGVVSRETTPFFHLVSNPPSIDLAASIVVLPLILFEADAGWPHAKIAALHIYS